MRSPRAANYGARFDFYGEAKEKSRPSQGEKTCCPEGCQAREKGC